ncbi:hypothetical protein RJ640_016228 [Escallonia rubra]|uniref:Diphthine--ammonia ligase n=1 Tax=Escallonia rubra TaxID=112253 RepID=A0AA88U4G1_9ASTE|nr:hypothetical protein RJ640_016228 [Escallonia rubra]
MRHHNLGYTMTPGDEVEDMFILLNEVKQQIPAITAVSSGAIASDYQRLRVESVCSRLGLVSLAYLWKQDQSFLLQEMIKTGISAIFVKVAAIGLDPSKHLGKELSYLKPHLVKLKELYGINVCGEGGEYETLTLDCPLFENARIVLDEFQILLHSSNSIAPVGILHPLAFHLEHKRETGSMVASNGPKEIHLVRDVQRDCLQRCEEKRDPAVVAIDSTEVSRRKLQISKTEKSDAFSVSCWLQDTCKTSADLQEDLNVVLKKIELHLMEFNFSWENVLYIHLYIDDMSKFAVANETYVKFITQDKCSFGVPSRSTIELPLLQAGLGRAYLEVLVAKEQSKRVLHVQSISCWAPSCIGPYSQATLHKEVLHMAGQLGLDPPTMLLCSGGPSAELEQALDNSEAVAQSFNCSILKSAVFFAIYCSPSIPTSERQNIHEKQEAFIKKMKLVHLDCGNMTDMLNPVFLYVLVPGLPKSASVEVKPILYAADNEAAEIDHVMPDQSTKVAQSYWGFQPEHWHDLGLQECIIHSKICAVILSITAEVAARIYVDAAAGTNQENVDAQISLSKGRMERIARFCIYRLDKILVENCFAWDDATNLRIYFPTSLHISHETLSLIFATAFDEFAEMSGRVETGKEPVFSLIPVLGAGKSATSMDDIITCELFVRKSQAQH